MHLIPYTEGRWCKYFSHIKIIYYHYNNALQNIKAMIRSLEGDTDFDIFACLAKRYIITLCIYNLPRLYTRPSGIKKNGINLIRKEAHDILQKLTNAYYINNVPFLINKLVWSREPNLSLDMINYFRWLVILK